MMLFLVSLFFLDLSGCTLEEFIAVIYDIMPDLRSSWLCADRFLLLPDVRHWALGACSWLLEIVSMSLKLVFLLHVINKIEESRVS